MGLAAFGAALIVCGFTCILNRPTGWKSRLAELAVAVILLAGFVLFCQWDPQSVMAWYMD